MQIYKEILARFLKTEMDNAQKRAEALAERELARLAMVDAFKNSRSTEGNVLVEPCLQRLQALIGARCNSIPMVEFIAMMRVEYEIFATSYTTEGPDGEGDK